ncbi:hypothetical protein FM038_015575 [Shewanella eurypsychrophilus]|uniref:T2SS protein L n=1 Tax=Shewanella eurypsychrophilus TaxID=2593656 RepID=A0ABX6V7V8_9GAMM|nr:MULTISPECIES: hypothetical protein [Shewanella]QFU23449.1 hypothetical protein FS418_17385 [Shewanella sp. YLB-09]QPG58678.1 hypothetical protein FM038_015575 [Shewanella eurypsychrophilus]
MKNRLKSILKNRISLYSNQWHQLSIEVEQGLVSWCAVTEPAKGTLISVIARGHYTETSREYKAPSLRELKAILKIEHQSQPTKLVQHLIKHVSDNRYSVTYWEFDAPVLASLPKSVKWLIPESLLFAQKDTVTRVTTHKGDLFSCLTESGIHSATSELGCQSIEHFMWMSSVSASSSQVNIDAEAYAQTLLTQLITSYSSWLPTCFIKRPVDGALTKRQLKQGVLASGILCCGYLALSSAYLSVKHHLLSAEYQQQSSEIANFLNENRQLQHQLKQYRNGEQLLNQLEISTPIWSILLPLIEQGVKFTQVEYKSELITVRGLAPSATQTLADISSQTRVDDAKFINAVSRNRGLERFAISFILKEVTDGTAE